MILGIFLLFLGVSRLRNKKGSYVNIIAIALGVAFVLFAIWLGFPK